MPPSSLLFVSARKWKGGRKKRRVRVLRGRGEGALLCNQMRLYQGPCSATQPLERRGANEQGGRGG